MPNHGRLRVGKRPMTRSGGPIATVVICTKDRGPSIVETIRSVLANRVHDIDVLVIDQSEDDATENAVAPFLSDTRMRYVRRNETGVARSRTLALREARTELVLNTDDDCIVPPDWVERNLAAFERHPSAAIVFGDVVAPEVEGAGYAPESVADNDFIVTSIWRWRGVDGANIGIGACMAMRRSALLALGGFDPLLGPGSRFRNAEDTDITVRALLAGHHVARTKLICVQHFGHRSHDEFRQLTRGAMFGLGAMISKPLRRNSASGLYLLTHMLWGLVARPALESLVRLRRPPVLGRLWFLAKGIVAGVRVPLIGGGDLLFAESGEVTDPRPKVAFITEQHVGLRTYSENLRRFAEQDDRIRAVWEPVTYVEPGGWIERLPLLPSAITGSIRGTLQVRRAIRRHRPDACLFLTQVPAALGGRYARRRPYVIMADDTPKLFDEMAHHYGIANHEPTVVRMTKHRANVLALRKAAVVLPMSDWARRSLITDYGVDPARTCVVPTGIDLEEWRPGDRDQTGPLRVLFVGGHFDRKGGAVLLRAFRSLPVGVAELHIVTMSDVESRQAVHVYRGMQANSTELIELFRSCDVLVLVSRAEAYPNVIVEACASGLPCIVSNAGAMSEMVADGVTGFVIDADDHVSLAARLQELASDRERLDLMAAAARQRAMAMFDGRVNARRVVDALLEATER
jgi:glycosyltransferase involved in cell wall biosynthesis/GT2 family glycosyltransferase